MSTRRELRAAAAVVGAAALEGSGGRRSARRADAGTRRRRRVEAEAERFASTRAALGALGDAGAVVAVSVTDLDTGQTLFAGGTDAALPVAGLAVVPLLAEVAAQIEAGTLDASEVVARGGEEGSGVWPHLSASALTVSDAAVLAAATGDTLAAQALAQRVGPDAAARRAAALGFASGDAASAPVLAQALGAIVDGGVVSPAVSAQVAEWLNRGHDVSLVGASTGLDPYARETDEHRVLFVNQTGRARGIRVDAGALGTPRATVAYALIVQFDEGSVADRLRVHQAFHVLGADLMEYVA